MRMKKPPILEVLFCLTALLFFIIAYAAFITSIDTLSGSHRRMLYAPKQSGLLSSVPTVRHYRLNHTSPVRNDMTTLPTAVHSPPSNVSCQIVSSSRNSSMLEVVPHRILVFVDYPFHSLFLNWLAHFTDVCGERRHSSLEVVYMDERVVSHVEASNLSCSKHSFVLPNEAFHGRNLIVWRRRMNITHHFLQQNISVLLSDLDALWRKDPYTDFQRLYDAGHRLIASRGSWPPEQNTKWGATVCMGFILLCPSRFTLMLVNTTYSMMQNRYPDDQQAINVALDSLGIQWPKTPLANQALSPDTDIGAVSWVQTRDHEYCGTTCAVTGGSRKLNFDLSHYNGTVALLPHDEYMRNCSASERPSNGIELSFPRFSLLSHQIRSVIANITIVHCNMAPGNAYRKFQSFKRIGMWHAGVLQPTKSEIAFTLGNYGIYRLSRWNELTGTSTFVSRIEGNHTISIVSRHISRSRVYNSTIYSKSRYALRNGSLSDVPIARSVLFLRNFNFSYPIVKSTSISRNSNATGERRKNRRHMRGKVIRRSELDVPYQLSTSNDKPNPVTSSPSLIHL